MTRPDPVSSRSVWTPIVVAAVVGFLAAVAVCVVVVLSWHPAGMGM